MSEEANKALNKAKIALFNIGNTGFIAPILFSLKIIWDESCPTMYTNGTVIGINPKFFLNFTPELRIFGLLHEAWHIALDHINRRENRDPKLWNMAGDHVINLQMKYARDSQGRKSFTIWDQCLCDDKYKGWSTDAIYKDLEQQQKDGSSLPDGGFGEDIRDPCDGTPASREAFQRKIDDLLVKAYTHSKLSQDGFSDIPGEVVKYIEELLDPLIPWQTVLMNYFTSKSKSDYSYRRPNKRYMPDLYLPSLYTESLGRISCICDSSGSIGEEEFQQFYSEAAYIKQIMNPEEFVIVSFDTDIRSVFRYGQDEPLDTPELEGGGGTNIKPVIKWLNDNLSDITIIFTDGDFRKVPDTYEGEVIWLIKGDPNFTYNFGTVIHMP